MHEMLTKKFKSNKKKIVKIFFNNDDKNNNYILRNSIFRGGDFKIPS